MEYLDLSGGLTRWRSNRVVQQEFRWEIINIFVKFKGHFNNPFLEGGSIKISTNSSILRK